MFELEVAKEDGYLPGLMYLDTARGISLIVEKLPFLLHKTWMTFGSKYKEDHNIAFLPFSVFSQFMKREAKAVQALANTFWARWRREYLSTLQSRRKWLSKQSNLKEGDVVLLKDKQARRNEWSMGRIMKTYPSKDGLLRKVEVKVTSHHPLRTYLRPISEMVLLLESNVV